MAEFVTKAEHKRRFITVIVCVVFDVLALAAGIWAMKKTGDYENGEKEKDNIVRARARVAKADEELQLMRTNIIDFSQPVGWRRHSSGTTDRHVTGSINYDKLQLFLNGWAEELKLRYGVTTSYEPWKGPGDSKGKQVLTLTQLFKELQDKESEYRKKAGELQTEIDGLVADEKKAAADAEAAAKDSKKLLDGDVAPTEAAGGQIGTYITTLKNLNALQKSHGEELATAEKAKEEKLKELTALRKTILRARSAYEAQKADLKMRINWRVHRLEEAKERREPDGEILAIHEPKKLAYVDLLHRDRLHKGTRFKVYSLEKGGVKIDKGEVEVIEVRDSVSSVVAITKVYDPKNPIKQGDKIYNEFYEKDKVRYIAFAGRFTGKLSNQEAAQMIKAFGDVYQERVDERTSYLIVAEGYEETPNFKAAQDFGVKVMLERYLYDYLGVP